MSTEAPDFPGQQSFHPVQVLENGRRYGMSVSVSEYFSPDDLQRYVQENLEQIRDQVRQYYFLQLLTKERPFGHNEKIVLNQEGTAIDLKSDFLSPGNTFLCDPVELLEYHANRLGIENMPHDSVELFRLAKQVEKQKKSKTKTPRRSKQRRKNMRTFVSHHHRHGTALFFGNAVVHDHIDGWSDTRKLQGHMHPSTEVVGILGIGNKKQRITAFETGDRTFFSTLTSTVKTWEIYQALLEKSGQ